MNPRIRSLCIAAIIGSAFAAGCTHYAQAPIVISNESTGIVAQGRGEIDAPPDVAIFNVGIELTAPSVAEARDQAAEASNRLMAALENDGIAREDIQTSGLGIQPQYEYPPNGKPFITGFSVNNQVTVKVRKIESTSRVIDDAVKAGGDDVRLQGIQFEIDDPTKLRELAREKALTEARAKAEQMAQLSGVGLGIPLAVEEVSFSAPPFPVPMFAGAMDKAAEATPIAAGKTTVSVEVRVRWAIKS
jgi:uncharacterized protein